MAVSSLKGSERLIKILLLLQSGKLMTVDGMAEFFGVSRRTIFRDLRSLQKLDVPITWDPYDGYKLLYSSQLPTFVFTKKELATLLVGLSFVKAQVDSTLVEDAKTVELKISTKLTGELRAFINDLSDKVVISPYLKNRVEAKGGDWFLLASAINENRAVMFTYTSKEGTTSQRSVDPLLLVFFFDHWNLFAYDREKKEIRNFILEQISELTISSQPFKTIAANYTKSELIYRSGSTFEQIEVHVEPAMLTYFLKQLPTESYERTSSGSVLFEHDVSYISSWLLQFGDRIRVLKPETLKAKRRAMLQKMLNEV